MKKLVTGSLMAALILVGMSPVWADSEMFFTGGGIIKEGKGMDARKITFAADVSLIDEGQPAGHFQVNFHDVDDIYGLDQGRFSAADFSDMAIDSRDFISPDDHLFVRFRAYGTFNGEEDWCVLARFSDFGRPARQHSAIDNAADATRLILFNPQGDLVYDTAHDYPREQAWRTLLDGGNVTVHIRIDSEQP